MKKQILSALVAAVMIIGVLPVSAFADEPVAAPGTVVVESRPDGGTEQVDVTVTVEKKDDGTQITTTATPEGGDRTESGLTVEYQGVNNGDGTESSSYTVENDTGSYTAAGGSESTTTRLEETPVNVEVIKDGEVQDAAVGSSNTANVEVSGELKQDDPANYDQTTVTTTDRTVTLTQVGIDVTTGQPVLKDENGNLMTSDDGYHYRYVSGGDSYNNAVGDFFTNCGYAWYQVKDADGNSLHSDSQQVIIVLSRLEYDGGTPENPEDDVFVKGLYCVDLNTDTTSDEHYRKVNLEDAAAEGYYSEEDAAHLRAILNNGYDFHDSDGSLSRIKEMLKKEVGKEGFQLTADDIDALTKDMAASATAMAIWQYGNRLEEGQTLSFVDARKDLNNPKPGESELVFALYNHLIGLEDQKKETQIIDEEKFINDMSLVVGSMVKDHENNQDNDSSNDVYDTSLKFSLVVTPDAEKDDLVIKVVNNEGEVIKAARIAGTAKEGEDFIACGEDGYYVLEGLSLQENSNIRFNLKLEGVQYLEEGVYVFKSKDNGTASQNMIGKGAGIAEVDVSMEVNMTFHVEEATVTTEHSWRSQRTDSTPDIPDDGGEGSDSIVTPGNPTPSPEVDLTDPVTPLAPQPEDVTEIPEENVPLAELPEDEQTELPEEEVPLADVPRTGDSSPMWRAAALISGVGLAWLVLENKKRGSAAE